MLRGVQRGTVQNGRQAAKALGHEHYKTRPASQALAAALDLVQRWQDAGTVVPSSFDEFLRGI